MKLLDPMIMTMSFFLIIVLALVLLLVTRRLVLGRYLRWRLNKIREWGLILDRIIARMGDPSPAEIYELKAEGPLTRSILEEILLARIDLMAGHSRLPLIKLFQQTNLLNLCIADLDSREVDKRRKAADMLGRAASREYSNYLVQVLNDPDGTVRMIAARGLGKMGIQIAAPAMVDQLEELEEKQCLVIVDALINLGSAALVPLGRALNQGSEAKRYFAALAIANICEAGRCQVIVMRRTPRRRITDVPAEFPADLPGRLINLTWDQSPRVRRAAVEALASLQVMKAAPRVEKMLAGDYDPVVRAAAAAALSLLSRAESATVILDALNDPSWEVRCQAANALIELGGPWLNRLRQPDYQGTRAKSWLGEIEAAVHSWN